MSKTPYPRVVAAQKIDFSEGQKNCLCEDVGDLGGVFGVLQAAALSFAHHLPLLLKPDDFWLMILQGVALHVSRDPDGLKHVFASRHYLKTV